MTIPLGLRDRILSMYQEALDFWPVPTSELTLPTRYGSIHVVSTGPEDGPFAVFFHGMSFPAPLTWATLEKPFLVSHRVIAPDTIGDVGKSELKSLKTRPRSGSDYARWVEDVLSQLVPANRQIDIIGASYGAWIVPVPAAARVQAEIGLRCGVFDLNSGCSGFVYGLAIADGLLCRGMNKVLWLHLTRCLASSIRMIEQPLCSSATPEALSSSRRFPAPGRCSPTTSVPTATSAT